MPKDLAPSLRVGTAREWWRSCFHDHPLLRTKQPEAYFGTNLSAKAKVYCRKCFDADIASVLIDDEKQVTLGTRQVVRSRSDIEGYCKFISDLYLGTLH
jgi:hypothetical protein